MSTTAVDRFVLGTAQLGMAYGITNKNSGPADASEILTAAVAGGITAVDTAAGYGSAETAIAAFVHGNGAQSPRIISKLRQRADAYSADTVFEEVGQIHDRFGRHLRGVLLHDANALDQWGSGLEEGFVRSIEAGMIEAAGVSVYTPDEFSRALSLPSLRIIQAPFSLFDRRVIEMGLLARAEAAGKRVYLRSIFLQGLLLMGPSQLPSDLAFAAPQIEAFQAVCRAHHISPEHAAIGYALHVTDGCGLVIGCDSVGQLRTNIEIFNSPKLTDGCLADLAALPQGDGRMINPSLWQEAYA